MMTYLICKQGPPDHRQRNASLLIDNKVEDKYLGGYLAYLARSIDTTVECMWGEVLPDRRWQVISTEVGIEVGCEQKQS